MKKMIIVGLFIVLPFFSFSQNLDLIETSSGDSIVATTMFNVRHNSVYNESFLVFCYERLIPIDDKFGIALKGGFVIFDPFLPIGEVATVFGGPKHFFETGIGAIIDPSDEDFVTFRLGYRYQAPKGFLFKVSPIYSPDNFILPLITLGYSF